VNAENLRKEGYRADRDNAKSPEDKCMHDAGPGILEEESLLSEGEFKNAFDAYRYSIKTLLAFSGYKETPS
jgi:hypothetical protein